MEFPTQFIRTISDDNPWWNSGKPPEIPVFHRSDFFTLKLALSQKGAHVLIGPRRVGKTKLLLQLIAYLITEEKVNPKNIAFLSIERPGFDLLQNRLLDAIAFYEQNIRRRPMSPDEEKTYLFIDEAQYDSAWVRQFKQYIDQGVNVFAIASGSSSTALFKDTKESGAGRLNTRSILPMKFRDVLRLRHPEQDEIVSQTSMNLRQTLIEAINNKDFSNYITQVNDAATLFATKRIMPDVVFEEYLLKGGYPEFYITTWSEKAEFYRTEVFDSIVQKDVVNIFGIKHPERLRSLLVHILNQTSMILPRQKLADAIQIPGKKATTLATLDQYLDGLTQAHLIRSAKRYTGERGRPSTKERKFFAADPGMRNAILGMKDRTIGGQERGALVETIVFDHALRFASHCEGRPILSGFYLKGKREEFDADLILDMTHPINIRIPIEAKSGQCDESDLRKLSKVARDVGAPFGILVCSEQIRTMPQAVAIPIWAFLLSV